MAYGICRIQKIKSWGELAGSGQHTTRERETLNADPELDNIRVIGEPNDPDLASMVRDKIGEQTIRKNAVLAVEILLSASPEYFRPDDPSSAGVYEQQQLDAWTEKSVDWLKEQYQDRVVRAELHLDESTPHIHAYLVPLDDKEKLNCRALFGGTRHTLSKLQDSYAEAVEPLGLERGIKGSQATYTAVKQYYSDVNRDSLNLDLEEQLPQPLKNEPATNYRERVIENLQPSLDIINHQLSDYSLALKQKDEMQRTARKLEQRVEELELKLKGGSDPQIDNALAKLTEGIAQSANRPPVITSQNSNSTDTSGSTDSSDDDDNETMGAIAPNQLQSNDATAPENASNLNHQTVQSDLTASSETDLTDLHNPTDPTKPCHDDDDLTDDDDSVNIDPIEENWLPLRSRLIEDCCLPSDLLDGLHEEGWVYANEDDMAVFSLRTLKDVETGVCAFDPGTGSNTWRDLNLDPDVEKEVNGEPAFFFIHPPNSELINKAILTSDPIEAISYAALDPSFGQNKTMYIATESADSLPIEFLQKLKENVVVSFKGDEDGLELAKDVMKVLRNSQKEELDEAGWNGILRDQEQEQEQERASEVEQIQLVPQYQSQQQSQMEL
jgi:hypothetical protein